MLELYKALFNAHNAIGDAKKKNKNPHLGSKYADLKSVHEAIGTALVDNNLLILMRPKESGNGSLVMDVTLVHVASGESLSWTVSMPIEKQTSQGFGSALTYLRRYVLLTVLDILTEDDDGEGSMNRENKVLSIPKKD
jgi:hypothetical protein